MDALTATTDKQSFRILKCGIPAETADMYLCKSNVPPVTYHQCTVPDGVDVKHWFSYHGNRDIIPAWSLSALLAILPREIRNGDVHGVLSMQVYGDGWIVSYNDFERGVTLFKEEDLKLTEACVLMVEVLHTFDVLK